MYKIVKYGDRIAGNRLTRTCADIKHTRKKMMMMLIITFYIFD